MFAFRTELSQEVVGFPATVLVWKRFVWPYGGRNVFLTGSFTRWSEHVPMSAMEDCPTVFQVVCNLTPGLHQYKFYVDGEWRHDECEPFVMGTYGIVNTIAIAVNLTQEPNPLPALLSLGKANNTGNMEVDNEGFQHMVTESDGITRLAALRISEADIMISRRRITEFLSTHMAYDLLPDSGKVIALDVNLPVKQAFHILHEQGISVAPLWDSGRGQFVGVLTALDFILILLEIGNHGSNLTEEELETHTISAWKEGKRKIYSQLDKHGRPLQRGIIQAGPCDSLKDVVIKILQNKVSTVPIIHSSSEDGSLPQLLHLASLSEILRCICRHYKHSSSSLPILQQPICEIPLGTWVPQIGDRCRCSLTMLRLNASLSSALSLMAQAEVSSIPIVDGNDALVDTYASSDITVLAKDNVYAQMHLDEMSVRQALQLGQDANSSHGSYSQRCQMCLRSDSLHKVMERLAAPGVRRLIIIEAGTRRVEGIISLSDVFRFLLG